MGMNTRTVGGGAATSTANDWNAFLRQQLTGQNVSPMQQDLEAATRSNNPHIARSAQQSLDAYNRQQQNNSGQPQQQQGAFQNAFQQMLSGGVNDLSGAGSFIQNFFQNGATGNQFTPQQYGNQYTSPEYVNPVLQQLATNFGAGQTGGANLSGIPGVQQSTFNTQGSLGPAPSSGFDSILMQLLSGAGNMQGQNGFSAASAGPGVSLAPGMDINAAMAAAGNLPFSDIARQRAIADTRARFGAEGAGSLGTGAQFAEGTLNADLIARMQEEQFNRAMGLMGQDLSERSTGANVALGSRGQDVQLGLGNMQGALQGAQNANSFNAANIGNILSALTSARGQDLSTGLGVRAQNLDQLGLGLQQDLANASNALTGRGQDLDALLQNQGLMNAFGLNAATLNNNAMQTNNANSLNATQFQNTFNQGNAQNFAQAGQAANALNSQNALQAQQLNNNFLTSMLGAGMDMNNMGNSNIMSILAQMFGAYGQQAGLGTPQAQVMQTPSNAMQIAQLGTSFLGSGGGNALLQRLFGGGGGNNNSTTSQYRMPWSAPILMNF